MRATCGAGFMACTGNSGCKLAASHTKTISATRCDSRKLPRTSHARRVVCSIRWPSSGRRVEDDVGQRRDIRNRLNTKTSMSSFIPQSAPFSQEQRAWLGGFFSGLMGIQPGMSPGDALSAAGIVTKTIVPPADQHADEDEDFPWHDSSLPIVDRMELAEGKPLKRRLMAAMAQLDCGSCGYLCETYSEAIASGEESNLTLCSPGGKETKQTIKKLLKEEGGDVNIAPVTHRGTQTDRMDTSQPARSEIDRVETTQSRGFRKRHSARRDRSVRFRIEVSRW